MSEIYFDHAATTPLPEPVLNDMVLFEHLGRGNPYRGLHAASERATLALQEARERVGKFVHGENADVIFTKSATEGLNLAIANMTRTLQSGDEVMYTLFDHHATLLPVLEAARARHFQLKRVDDFTNISDAMSKKTKLVIAPHVSNVLGAILPVADIVEAAKAVQAMTIIDGAQAVGHLSVDFQAIGSDAYAFSAHKMYGPMGIGALVVKKNLLPTWQPLFYGGGMVEEVFFNEHSELSARYLDGYRKFEAGTPNVTGAVGFKAACDYVTSFAIAERKAHEGDLTKYAIEELKKLPKVTVFETNLPSIGIVSFSVSGMHPHDVSQELADHGIAVRAGYHCATPLAKHLHESGTVRLSFGLQNKRGEIDVLLDVLRKL